MTCRDNYLLCEMGPNKQHNNVLKKNQKQEYNLCFVVVVIVVDVVDDLTVWYISIRKNTQTVKT